MEGVFRAPKEPGAGGTIILSMIGGLILSHASWGGWFVGLLVAVVTFFTFDYAFDSYRSWRIKGMTTALGLNGLAYILPALYWWRSLEGLVDVLLIPFVIVGIIFAFHFTFSRARGWKDPVTYALGNLLPAVPVLFAPAVAGRPFGEDVFIFWLLLAYYEAIGAAYVETKLAFRKFPRKYPLIAWLPAFLVVLYNPYLVLALIEPTIRLTLNLRDNTYAAKMDEIKKLGWSVFKSVMLLYIITLAVLYLT
ncbi:hypothetical protein [Thermococcus sp.]|uniref:hypothetical protein n=1 Tax=Thermococcus sp. TaxID=35749 RepID=UPI0026129CC0|nr:hypothetical protein [Thermococcus sp.]